MQYRALVASGAVTADPLQARVAERLDTLGAALAAPPTQRRRGFLARLRSPRNAPVRGLYVYGAVGRGKTMLMDLFHGHAPVSAKRRAHYNAFMADIHARVHARRRAAIAGDDAVAAVATAVAAQTRLLCLDEFMVTDIADAMILSRLFGEMFAAGLVLVTTSNSAPEDLYPDGLNRGLFLPFIDTLRRQCDVVSLDGDTDYRQGRLTASEVYITPLDGAATAALDATWRRLTGGQRGKAASVRTMGRDVAVPLAAGRTARFGFDDLCRRPLAAADYLAIAGAFDTLVVDGVPLIADGERDVARRLIQLVDVLYDNRIRLIVSAAGEPGDLYRAAWGAEAAAFERTRSRLIEMRSESYLTAAREANVGAASGKTAVQPLAQADQSG